MKKLVFLGVACALAGTVSPNNARAQSPTERTDPGTNFVVERGLSVAAKAGIRASGATVARAGVDAWGGMLSTADSLLISPDAQAQIAGALLRGNAAPLANGLKASGVPAALATDAATSFAALSTDGKGQDLEYRNKLHRATSAFNRMATGVPAEMLAAPSGQFVGMRTVLKQATDAYNRANPATPLQAS
jgi:CTP:molybdopterin cytidylyltransferase MocA